MSLIGQLIGVLVGAMEYLQYLDPLLHHVPERRRLPPIPSPRLARYRTPSCSSMIDICPSILIFCIMMFFYWLFQMQRWRPNATNYESEVLEHEGFSTWWAERILSPKDFQNINFPSVTLIGIHFI